MESWKASSNHENVMYSDKFVIKNHLTDDKIVENGFIALYYEGSIISFYKYSNLNTKEHNIELAKHHATTFKKV